MFWAALAAALPLWGMLWWLLPPDRPLHNLGANPGAFLMTVVAYPAVEEIVFRGMIQGFLAQRTGYRLGASITLANLATSVIFALLHGIVWGNAWALLVFFPSLVFGYFRDETGGLAAPISLHAFYNMGFFLATANQFALVLG